MVRCGTCGTENRDGARFCTSCGADLGVVCPACGSLPARPGARFCDACGAELAGAAAPVDQSRKVITVLFADLVGSTSAQEGADPEAVRRWVDRYYAVLRREVEAQGGRVAKFTGDGVMGVFGSPEVREDDARRALEAALALHAAVADLGGGAGAPARVALRIGVNTGEVVVSSDDDDVVGDAVNVAARLQTAAGAGQTLVGESTFRLVRLGAQLRALPPLELKGKAAPVNAFLVLSLARGEDVAASPFVGRAGELERLLAVLDAAIADRRARLASIVGSPGVGKTRLVRELTARASDRARVVEVRCEAAGGATFAPIAAALRQAASLDDDADPDTVLAAVTALFEEDDKDRHRVAAGVASILGVGEPGLPEETFWAVRRLIENAAARGPIVFLFDDVHWAEPLLLDLIENVAEWSRDVPVVLIVTARPELRDLRPSLVEVGGRVQAAIHLEGLEAAESRRLTTELVGGADLPDALLDRIATASEGNPLFVGELVRMLVDDGVLELVEGAWRVTVDLAEIEVPVTIHALLAARIDRLAPGERAVLEAASVVGKTFYRGVLGALLSGEVAQHLDEHLEGLRRKELVEPAGTYWLDEPVLRFHHVLIRDAAYRRLLKETRATLHEQAARWLEVKVGDLIEHDDVIGYQLEQAHLLRAEAGDEQTGLGLAAADRLAAAGRRALEADDLPVAASLLGRALGCLSPVSGRRAELLVDRCEALLGIGDATEAAGAVAELAELAARSPRLEAWASCFAGELANLRDAGALAQTAERAEAAAAQLAALGDSAGEAKAHAVRAASLARLGRIAECEASLDRALAAARRAGDRRRATAILAGAPVAALWGPNPVTRASGRCLDVVRVLRITSRAPAVEATSLRCQAVLEGLRGRDDAARRMLGSARRSLEELGHEHGLLEVDLAAGMVELLADRGRDAEHLLRRAHEGFHALGVDVDAGLAAALLARVRLSAGDGDEALELTVESEKLGGDDLKAGIAWRAVRAEALAHRGELDRARRLAEEAVALAAPTDALLDHADALVALAEVLRLSGDPAGAADRARAALELYERKEASVPAARAAALLGIAPARPRAGEDTAGEDMGHPAELENAATRFCARWVPRLLAADWDRVWEMFAEGIVGSDRRPLLGGTEDLVGRDAVIEGNQGVLAVGVTSLLLTPLAIAGDRVVLMHAAYGGEAGSSAVLQVMQVTEDDRLLRSEVFDLDQRAEAMARLHELAGVGAVVPENHASRTIRRCYQLFLADDPATRAVLHDDVVAADHRPVVGGVTIVGGNAVRDYLEGIRAVGVETADLDLVAVRGDDHCLIRGHMMGPRGDVDGYQVVVARDGRVLRSELFDPDQHDEALRRLDELHLAPSRPEQAATPVAGRENAATHSVRARFDALLAQDWSGMSALLAPDVVRRDHRAVVGGIVSRGREEILASQRALHEVGVESIDVRVLETRGERACLTRVTYTALGGATAEVLQVAVVDELGRGTHSEVYDSDDLDAATSRLDELAGSLVADELENAAARTCRALNDRALAGDWDAVAAAMHADLRYADLRPLVGGIEMQSRGSGLDYARAAFASGIERVDNEVLAVRGDRLALLRTLNSGARGEVENLTLVELDEQGLVIELDVYDPSQLAQALERLDDRYSARFAETGPRAVWGVVRALHEALNAHDVRALAAVVSEQAVVLDHPPTSHGPIRGAEYLDTMAEHFVFVPDAWWTIAAVHAIDDRAALVSEETGGMREGGAFVVPRLAVLAVDHDRVAEMHTYAPEHRVAAEARFAELGAVPKDGGAVTGLHLESSASRAVRVGNDVGLAGNWEAVVAGVHPDVHLADRRPLLGGFTAEGPEAYLEFVRSVFRTGVTHVEVEAKARRGEHLALVHVVHSGPMGSLATEQVVQLDDAGRHILRHELFDPSQLDDAFTELDDRFLAGEGAVHDRVWRTVMGLLRSACTQDLRMMDGLLSPQFEAVDHRPVGFGQLSRAEYLEFFPPVWTESPDTRWRMVRDLGCTPDVAWVELDVHGTRDGGPYTNPSQVIVSVDAAGMARLDVFALGQLDEARAAFQERLEG